MNKLTKSIITAVILAFAGMPVCAQNLSDILGGLGEALGGNGQSSQNQTGQNNNGGSSTLGNILEGVFSSSNITVSDMAGVWTSNGPAVCFQSDNFLQKAGGIAAASMIESKLSPYYNQYGLNGAVMTINTDGTFSMKLKNITLKGNITQTTEKGVFQFTFTALGSVKLGSIKTYVQKSYNTLSVMFDASKLKNLISGIAKIVNIQIVKTLTSILDSYQGLCVGFRMERTGNVKGQSTVNQAATMDRAAASADLSMFWAVTGVQTALPTRRPAPLPIRAATRIRIKGAAISRDRVSERSLTF